MRIVAIVLAVLILAGCGPKPMAAQLIKRIPSDGAVHTFDMDIASADTRHILVAANNSQPDAVVGGININDQGGYTGLHLDARSYPVGNFKIDYHPL